MKKKRFSVEQMIGVLKHGMPGLLCTSFSERYWYKSGPALQSCLKRGAVSKTMESDAGWKLMDH